MEMRQKNVLMSVVVTKYAAMMGVLLSVSTMLLNQVYIADFTEEWTKAHLDKSLLGQKPTEQYPSGQKLTA